MNYSAIVLCAGSGTRTGLKYNKMFYSFNGVTVYERTMQCFLSDERCRQVVVVTKDSEREDFVKFIQDTRITYVTGGKERQDSVYNGLQAVSEDYVLIHDGARPYLSKACIDRLLDTLVSDDGCLLMVPCKDTIKVVVDGVVQETLDRSKLMQAQTPQAFKTDIIKEAYQKAKDVNYAATDDSQLAEKFMHLKVKAVLGDYENKKITTPEDLV